MSTAMLKKRPHNHNHNQTNPKPQPKPKTQPKTQPPEVVVHTKIALQQSKKKLRKTNFPAQILEFYRQLDLVKCITTILFVHSNLYLQISMKVIL
jgi:hypothetical protein